MTTSKISRILLLSICVTVIISCTKEKSDELPVIELPGQKIDTLQILHAKDFLFNIPIIGDTLFADKTHGIDFRVGLDGYKIESVAIIIDKAQPINLSDTIINTMSFYSSQGIQQIEFLLRSISLEKGDTVFFKSNQLFLQVLDNISHKFLKIVEKDGRLNISWPVLDEKFTQYYLIERYMGHDKEYLQEFEVADSIFIDNYYLGEEVDFNISLINKAGRRQNIWHYRKEKENLECSVTKDTEGGYNIHFSRSKYYNNFGEFYLTTGENENSEFLYSSVLIEDTIYHNMNAKFADEERFWLRYFPKEFPAGVSAANWQLYGHFLYARYGEKSFKYDRIARLDDRNVVYIEDGDIYLRNLETDQITGSIINPNARFGLLRTTPAGDYLYAVDQNLYGSPVYFWPADALSLSPKYTFHLGFSVPPVSDNLIAIRSVPSNAIPSNLGLFNITNGNIIHTTQFIGTSFQPTISSNGQYVFIHAPGLKLCSFIDNVFEVVWEETDRGKSYYFYDFNPIDNGTCYTWDGDKQFSTRNTSDFSPISSFELDVEGIINIDYHSGKIMGYISDKVLIYNLVDGKLEREIPANIGDFFYSDKNTILIGNIIYSHHGIKYRL